MTRSNRRLLFGAIAVLIPVLAGCEAGNNAPMLAYHPASDGVSVIKDGITIDNVFVLGPAVGSTLKIGGRASLFAAMSAENGDRLESVTAPDAASSVTVSGGTINMPQQALIDLHGPKPQLVLTGLTHDLQGGATIQIVFTFAEAGPIRLSVPVEPRGYDYTTYSPPAIPGPKASVKPVPSGSVSPGATPAANGGTTSATATP